MRVAVNLFSCSPNGDLKMWDMRAFKVCAFSFSARSISPFRPLSFVFKFNRLLQNTSSMAGVGDGITSMAVHPHLPILAIGSMGQVSHPARRCFLKKCLNRAFSGCSNVLCRNWSAGAPDTVRRLP
jgi:hypothetical protein